MIRTGVARRFMGSISISGGIGAPASMRSLPRPAASSSLTPPAAALRVAMTLLPPRRSFFWSSKTTTQTQTQQQPLLSQQQPLLADVKSASDHTAAVNETATTATPPFPTTQAVQQATSQSSAPDSVAKSLELDPSLSEEFTKSLNKVLNPVVDAASTTVTEITSISQLSAMGLCNYTPIGVAESLIGYVHVLSGLPWWATIVATTVIIRLMLLPVVVKTQRVTSSMNKIKPKVEPLMRELNEAKASNDKNRMARAQQGLMKAYQDADLSPFASLWGLLQVPVFICFFFALRSMAELPVPGFSTGGFGFVQNLTIMDPTYILPLIASGLMMLVMEFSMEAASSAGGQYSAGMRMLFRGMIILFIPFTATLPAAVFMYWVPSNFITLIQFFALRNPAIKRVLGIPPGATPAAAVVARPPGSQSGNMCVVSPIKVSRAWTLAAAAKKVHR